MEVRVCVMGGSGVVAGPLHATDSVRDLVDMIRQRLELDASTALKLVHGTSELRNADTLAASGIVNDSEVTCVLGIPGPQLVQHKRFESAWESTVSIPVTQSAPLLHPVYKVTVEAGTYMDQDGGNTKSDAILVLKDQQGKELARRSIWGCYRSHGYPHGPHPPAAVFTLADEIVQMAKPGCTFGVLARVGNHGGHRVRLLDLQMTIEYPNALTDEPSDVVQWKPRDLTDLGAALSHVNEGARCFAATKLVEDRGKANAFQPQLIRALADSSHVLQQRAAEALGNLGPTAAAAAEPLMQMVMEDVDKHVSWEGAVALAKIDPTKLNPIMPLLFGALEGDSLHIVSKAVQALDSLGRSHTMAVPHLLKAYQKHHTNRSVRSKVEEALCRICPNMNLVRVHEELHGALPLSDADLEAMAASLLQ